MSLFDEMSDNALGVKSSQANQASRFDQMSDDVLKSQQPATDEGNFTRGFKNSFRQLPQLGYGIEAIAGATGEKLAGEGGLFTGLKQHGLKNYQQETAELAPYSHENDSISTAWDKAKGGDIGALGDFAGYGLGYVAGQGAQALATAGVGKLLAQQGVKTLAPSVIEAVAAKEAAKLAGKGLTAAEIEQVAAKNALAKIGSYGANTALAANALGMEGGEIGGGMVANAEQRGTPLTGEELVKGGLSTLGAGALEYLGDKIGIDAAFGKMPIGKALSEAPGISGRVGRGLVGGAIAAVPEAGTEYGQTMLEQYGQGQDPFSAESQRQAIDAAALGALGGQVMGGVGGLVSSTQPQIIEKPISDGPLGNAAAAGGITTTEVIDAGQADTEIQPAPGQEPGAIANPVLPATDGLDTPNVGLPGAELPADASGEATGEIPLAEETTPSTPLQESAPQGVFQPTHELEDGTPVRYAEDDIGPYFEAADGTPFEFSDTATPITQEAVNANNPDGNAVTDNSQAAGTNSGAGSDQRGFDARLEPTDGRADDRGISGVDGQLRGTELPSDVESGGTLDETSTTPNINVSQAQTSESELPSMEDTASATGTTNTAAFVGDATTVSNQPGNLNAQTPETQPVLPDTGANQTGNAPTVGAGEGQSAISGQEEVAPPSYQSAVDAQFKQKSYDAPTKALGGMTPREYGKQHVEAGHQFVEKDGKYYLKGDGAGMKQIPKATYLYGSALEKASRESGDYMASETTQATPQAIHIEEVNAHSVTRQPRLAESADELYKKSVELSTKGHVLPNGRIVYPVVNTLGDGVFQYTPSGEWVKWKDNTGASTSKATKSDVENIHHAFDTDTAQIEARMPWGQAIAGNSGKVEKVLHSPRGNSFKQNAVQQAMVSESLKTQPKAEPTAPIFDKLDKAKGIVPATHKAIKDRPDAERIAMIHNRFNDVLNDHGFEPAHNINGNLTNRIRITC